MNAAVIGASGYSGEELVRLLSRHPDVHLRTVTSRSLAGTAVAEVMPGLQHLVGDLAFEASEPEALASRKDLDVVFLALPHGVATEFAIPLHVAGKTVIDLSADFRLNSAAIYEAYYGTPHPAPSLLEAPYVIPELTESGWQRASLIACPGCYPTSIQLPLVPLLREGLVETKGIIINSYSAVSGAGKKVAQDYLFCERNESLKGYGMPKHRHLSEIEEQLSLAAQEAITVQFNPHLAPISRGILTTIVVAAKQPSVEFVYDAWNAQYGNQPFVNLLPAGQSPDTRHVSGTNRADLAAVYDPRTHHYVIHAAIDNLLKGASGQAVQILNLKAGFDETAGLV